MAPRKRAAKADETKTYILDLKGGNTRKITIPAHWKMTFGQLVPYEIRGNNPDRSGVALRLYEGNKENLRAVMTDVIAIRDASIDMLEKRTSVQSKHAQKKTPQGMRDVVVEARMTEWVNPDQEEDTHAPDEFKKLSFGDDPAF